MAPHSVGGNRWEQDIAIDLTWNSQKLGPCARVCAKEWVTITPRHKHFEGLRNDKKKWWPTCAEQIGPNGQYVYAKGDPENPNMGTWKWDSPRLFDTHWWQLDSTQLADIAAWPTGTVVAHKEHFYAFLGTGCNGTWKTAQVVHMLLVIRNINGTNQLTWEVDPAPHPSLS